MVSPLQKDRSWRTWPSDQSDRLSSLGAPHEDHIEGATDIVRFRMRDLFIATAVFSVALGLFQMIGIWGALFAFLTAGVFTLYLCGKILPLHGRSRALAQRRILLDFLWGVCMPIICLAFDPIFFIN